ncbi:MAG: hypothetical protein KVP17_003504 [Porospora cf. gigantea B]|uniref:uncharacterized protein n=2 Tax=Porospora cf. gigantea B TaxID=2853592 RepID=UPI00357182F8|nr:MAG: hypothetical protein KVP17_003504 [Porospora cf. gigantea B]
MTVTDSVPSDSSESSTYSESEEELLVASAEALVDAVCRRDVTGLMRLLDLPLGKKSVNDVSMDHGDLLATPLQVCMLLCRVRELACLLWECSQQSTEEPLSFDKPFDGIPVLHLGLNLAPDASLLRFTYLLLFLPELLRRHQRNPDDRSIQSVLAEAVAVCLLVSPSKYVDFEVGFFPVEAIENIDGEVLAALNNISGQWLTIVDRWKEKPESAPSWSVDVDVTDDQGLTLLVLACRRKAVNIIDILLHVGARVDVLDDTTHLPLEHAIASGLDGPVLAALLDMTERSDRMIISQRAEKTKIFKLCMRHQSWSTLLWYIQRLQSEGAITEEDTEVLSSLAEDLGSVLMLHTVLQESGVSAAHSNVCVFTSKACYVHLGVEPHDLNPASVLASNLATHLSQSDIRQVRNINGKFPENPSRIEVLLDPQYGLLRRANLPIVEVDEPANLVDLLRVHDWSYLHSLMVAADASVTPSHDAMISRVVPLDADTAVTAGSWLAASCAARAVVEAASRVCKGDTKRAFCCIRPPGHHMGVYGACQPAQRPGEVTEEDMAVGSQGFCLLNNVAVGVAYVKAK